MAIHQKAKKSTRRSSTGEILETKYTLKSHQKQGRRNTSTEVTFFSEDDQFETDHMIETKETDYTGLYQSINSMSWEDIQSPSSTISFITDTAYSIVLFHLSNFLKSNNSGDKTAWSNVNRVDLSRDAISNKLSSKSQDQLYNYISRIIRSHNNVPYHSVHHIFHVLICANKMLHMIQDQPQDQTSDLAKSIQSHRFLQFAFIFSALIHDLDHQGVSNQQLIDQGHRLARKYNGSSVSIAENHSVDLAFEILSHDEYNDLVKEIFGQGENGIHMLDKFHESVRDLVLTTDIANVDRKQKVAKNYQRLINNELLHEDEKVLYALEQCLLACDVAPLQQSWTVYRQWCLQLWIEFKEADTKTKISCPFDGKHSKKESYCKPSHQWNDLQICFLDGYIFPLSRRLDEMEIFTTEDGKKFLDLANTIKKRWAH